MIRKKSNKFISTFVQMMLQVGSVSKRLFILNYLFALADGILASQSIIWLQKVFDKVAENSFQQGIWDIVKIILIWLSIRIAGELVNGLYNVCGEEHALRSNHQLGSGIHRKIGKLEPILFENEETLNQIKQSYRGSSIGRNFVNTFVTALFLYVPYYVSLFVYLYRKEPIFVLIIGIILIISIVSQLKKSKFYIASEEETMGYRRRIEYYSECIGEKELAKETKLLGIEHFFENKIIEQLKELLLIKKKSGMKSAFVDIGIHLITYIGYACILGFLFFYLVQGKVTIGLFAGIFCSIDSIFETTNSAVEECISYGMELRGKIETYLDFLKLKEKEVKTNQINEHGVICATQVSFTYPEGNYAAIQKIDLAIHKGEHIAIVGENGSGKTTLVRLLMGIFLAECGTVTHNGQDVSECNRYSIYQNTTGVFQQFGKYKMSLKDNIRIGSPNKMLCEDEITKQLSELGFTINPEQYHEGFDTVLAKEYGGIDLSSGQWNRIAIARGLFKEHDLIVLDEPTSAIDPIEEKRLYELFAKISENKTSIIITHRLGSVKLANRIIVMDQGKIIGDGSHSYLLENCIKYRTMWELQKGMYLEAE